MKLTALSVSAVAFALTSVPTGLAGNISHLLRSASLSSSFSLSL